MLAGTFVRVLFPTSEKPRRPGLLQIGYVLGRTATRIVVAYTTSQPWPKDTPLPRGAKLFTAEEAARLNQSRAFVLRLDMLAQLPPTEAWFPDLAKPGQGVIAVAPARLKKELEDMTARLLGPSGSLVQMRGP